MRRLTAIALAVVVVAGAAAVAPRVVDAAEVPTATPAVTTAPTPTAARVGPPKSLSVIGDSISAGTGAFGTADSLSIFNAGQEQPENSWATGTSGGLNSIYQRLVALQPSATIRSDRRAVNGADMSNAPGQASAIPTGTEYVLIQMGGNDLCKSTEAQMTSVADYRTRFTSTLTNVWTRSPNALVYVASVPDIYNLWYLRGAPNPPNPSPSAYPGGLFGSRFFWSGASGVAEFPCQSLLRDADSYPGAAEDRRLRVRQRNIELNEVLAAECAKYKYCRFDDYALFNMTSNRVWSSPGPAPTSAALKPANQFGFTDSDISRLDHFHPAVAGQRKLADLAWTTSYDFTDVTAPTVSASVGETVSDGGTRRVSLGATDAGGVRAIEYRTHLPSGVSAWQTVLNTELTSVDMPNLATELAWVETRALDRNGNMSASKVTTVYPLPGAPAGPTFSQTSQNGVSGMRVIWRAPSDESARAAVAPTIAYEVTASPGGGTCRTEAASLDPVDIAAIPLGCLISGLTYGETYSFSVRGLTQGGPGPSAPARFGQNGPTSAVFRGPSGPVETLTVTPSGADLVLHWAQPTNLGIGSLKGYEVRSRQRSTGGSMTVVPGCATIVTSIPGRLPVTTYFTDVQCTLPAVVPLEDYDFDVAVFTELASTPPTILTSERATVSGWLPGVPVLDGSPTASMAAVGRTATVTWPRLPAIQVPPGSLVTVTAQPGGATCTVSAELTSCAITGISPLVPYSFSVVVTNGVGTATGSTTGRLVIPATSVAAFLDIAATNFAAVPARWLLANGVTTGIDAASTKFGPSQNVTRGQLALFLWRLEGRPVATVPCGVTDVAGASTGAVADLARAVCWMKSRTIATGSTYRPTVNLTRGDMALFLWRLKGAQASSASCGFSDVTTLGDTGKAACWLRSKGVIDPKTTYNPTGLVTRGQMAKFLYNIANLP